MGVQQGSCGARGVPLTKNLGYIERKAARTEHGRSGSRILGHLVFNGRMGKRGPAPKPQQLRVLHGARASRTPVPPVPSTIEVVRPDWLPASACGIWDRLAPDLVRRGVLTHLDVDLFATFCATAAVHREAIRRLFDAKGEAMPAVTTRGRTVKNPAHQIVRDTAATMASLSGRFGLTPSDRAQMTLPPDRSGDGRGPERLLS